MSARTLVASVVLAFVACGTASSSSGWRDVALSRHKGMIDASLSYEVRTDTESSFSTTEIRRLRLVVRRAGRVVIDIPVRGGAPWVQNSVGLTLRNVWGGPQPEALVDISVCGNRCGVQLEVGLIDGAGHGQALFHDFGGFWSGPGSAWHGQWREGTFYFVSYDQRFFCGFSSCAGGASST